MIAAHIDGRQRSQGFDHLIRVATIPNRIAEVPHRIHIAGGSQDRLQGV
jgi:hypothetical protein